MDHKSENRKRFQDKQRLKRSHQTPSDRKYRKKAEDRKQDQTPHTDADADAEADAVVDNNHDRYVEIEAPEEDITHLRELTKRHFKEDFPEKKTTKIQDMNVDELNSLLSKNTKTTKSSASASASASASTSATIRASATTDATPTATLTTAAVPLELHDDQDFLDSLL
ncbi:hypothetical protein RNJ44_00458 [Nakaseomyces bracarensis]|uniref:Uncharacterized protein n=1 Tax=Nakaseomyces bracarensis TaxID=273131 RepID=A0ABR4NSM6_9SACH